MKGKLFIGFCVVFALMIGCFVNIYAEGYVYKNYDFEAFTNSNNGMPEGILRGGFISSSTESPVSGRYLCFQNAGGLINVNIANLNSNGSTKLLFSCDVKITNANTSARLFGGTQYTNATGTYIDFKTNHKIDVGGTEIGTYVNNAWYKVEALIDTVNQKADIFLDGERICSDIAWIWDAEYTSVLMRPLTSGANYSLQLDNIMYTDDPQYFPQVKVYFGIESATPEDGALNVPLTTTVKIKFEQSVDTNSYSSGELPISISGGAFTIESLSFDNDFKELTAELTGLEYATLYTVDFNKDLKSTEGAYLSSLAKLSFTTAYLEKIFTFDKESEKDPDDAENKVGCVNAATTMTSGRVDRIDTEIVAKGSNVVASIQVYIPESAELSYFAICPATSEGKANSNLYLMADGTVRVATPDSNPIVGMSSKNMLWKKGQWHTIEFVINTNTAKGSYYLNGYPVATSISGNFNNVRFINISPIGTGFVYIDNASITNNVQRVIDTEFNIVGSAPEDGAMGVLSDGLTIYFDFNKGVDESTLLKSSFAFTNGVNDDDISDIWSSNGGKRVALKLKKQLLPNTEYTLTVTGVSSEYGVALTGSNSITFTVEPYVNIGGIDFYDGNGVPLTGLESGVISVSANAENFTSENAKATLMIALCIGDENCFYIEKLVVAESDDILPGDNAILQGEIDVADTENRFIKALVWDSMDDMNSLYRCKNIYIQQ